MDQSKKTMRHFYCRDVLWETFEQMANDFDCSIDYLVNEAMRYYARSKNYQSPAPQSRPRRRAAVRRSRPGANGAESGRGRAHAGSAAADAAARPPHAAASAAGAGGSRQRRRRPAPPTPGYAAGARRRPSRAPRATPRAAEPARHARADAERRGGRRCS